MLVSNFKDFRCGAQRYRLVFQSFGAGFEFMSQSTPYQLFSFIFRCSSKSYIFTQVGFGNIEVIMGMTGFEFRRAGWKPQSQANCSKKIIHKQTQVTNWAREATLCLIILFCLQTILLPTFFKDAPFPASFSLFYSFLNYEW